MKTFLYIFNFWFFFGVGAGVPIYESIHSQVSISAPLLRLLEGDFSAFGVFDIATLVVSLKLVLIHQVPEKPLATGVYIASAFGFGLLFIPFDNLHYSLFTLACFVVTFLDLIVLGLRAAIIRGVVD